MATYKERYLFTRDLALHTGNLREREASFLNDFAPVCNLIMRHSATLARLAVEKCNAPWTPPQEAQEQRLTKRIAELAFSLGCGTVFSDDPMGCVVKITTPDGFTNDWANEGICVPTSCP